MSALEWLVSIGGLWYDVDPSTFKGAPVLESVFDDRESAVKAIEVAARQYGSTFNTEALVRAKADRHTEWLMTTLTAGTKKDRVGALQVLLEEGPVSNSHTFSRMLQLCDQQDRRKSLEACQKVKDVMVSCILPDRPLRFLNQFREQLEKWEALTEETVEIPRPKKKRKVDKKKQAAPPPPKFRVSVTQAHLALMHYEEYLKVTYALFVKSISALTTNNLSLIKTASLKILFDLLVRKPEQEATLLDNIVRRLADKEKKAFATVKTVLLDVCRVHRGMKRNVIDAVAQVGLKNSSRPLLLMHAIDIVSSVKLFEEDAEVAARVCKLYLEVLTVLLDGTERKVQVLTKAQKRQQKRKYKKVGRPEDSIKGMALREDCGRLVRMLLIGIKRTLHLLKPEQYESLGLATHVEGLFKLVKNAPAFKVRLVVLVFLFELLSKFQVLDRSYYVVLHQQLSFYETYVASNRDVVLRLLARVVEANENPIQVAALIRRVIQFGSHVTNVAFQQGVLELVCLAADKHPAIRNLLQKRTIQNKELTQKILEDEDQEEAFGDIEDSELTALRKRIGKKKSEKVVPVDSEDEDEIIEGEERKEKASWKEKQNLPYAPELCFPSSSRALNGLLWEIDLLGCHCNCDVAELVPLLATRPTGGSLIDPTKPLSGGKTELLEISLSEKEKRHRAGERSEVHSDSEPDDEQIDNFLDNFFAKEMGMDDMENMLDGFSDEEEPEDNEEAVGEGEVWGEESSEEICGYSEMSEEELTDSE